MNKQKNTWTRYQKEPFRWLYNLLANFAGKQKKEFNLSFEEFLTFTEITKCHYCETEIKWQPYSRYRNPDGSRNNKNKSSAAYYLDRKDNIHGYTAENCIVCCTLCNAIKSNKLSYQEMKLLGNRVKQIQISRNVR